MDACSIAPAHVAALAVMAHHASDSVHKGHKECARLQDDRAALVEAYKQVRQRNLTLENAIYAIEARRRMLATDVRELQERVEGERIALSETEKAATLRHQETSDLLSEKRSLISQLQEIDEAKAAAATAEDERRSKVRSLQAETSALRAAVSKAQTEVADHLRARSGLSREFELLEEEHQQLCASIKTQNARLQALAAEVSSATQQNTNLQQLIDKAKASVAEAVANEQHALTQRAAAAEQSAAMRARIQQAEEELTALKRSVMVIASEQDTLNTQVQQERQSVEEHHREIDESAAKLRTARSELDAARKLLEDLRQKRAAAQAALDVQQEQLHVLQAERAAMYAAAAAEDAVTPVAKRARLASSTGSYVRSQSTPAGGDMDDADVPLKAATTRTLVLPGLLSGSKRQRESARRQSSDLGHAPAVTPKARDAVGSNAAPAAPPRGERYAHPAVVFANKRAAADKGTVPPTGERPASPLDGEALAAHQPAVAAEAEDGADFDDLFSMFTDSCLLPFAQSMPGAVAPASSQALADDEAGAVQQPDTPSGPEAARRRSGRSQYDELTQSLMPPPPPPRISATPAKRNEWR